MYDTHDVIVTDATGRQQTYQQVQVSDHRHGMILTGVDGKTYIFAAQTKRVSLTNKIWHMNQREWNLAEMRTKERLDHVHVEGTCTKNRSGYRCEESQVPPEASVKTDPRPY